jgi:hypothetical protein
MGRLLPLLLLLPVLAFGAWMVTRYLRSDEERVRATIEEMVEEWNDMSVRGVTARMSDEFEAQREGRRIAGKDDVTDALRYFYAQEGDLLAGSMPWSAELDADTLVVELEAPGGPRYEATIRFRHASRPPSETAWVARVSGGVIEEGGEWMVRTAEIQTLEGTQLGGRW